MRVAGIDYGKARVGVAVSDELGLMAHPRPFLDATSRTRLLDELLRLSQEERIELFVVGLPRQLDGREGPSAVRARKLARQLEAVAGVRVVLVDEWFTTKEAAARLTSAGRDARSARSRIDSAAATVLLQSYLDGQRASGPFGGASAREDTDGSEPEGSEE